MKTFWSALIFAGLALSSHGVSIKSKDGRCSLYSALNQQRLANEFTDVILRTPDGQRFPAHRLVLAAESPVFARRFEEEEKNGGNPDEDYELIEAERATRSIEKKKYSKQTETFRSFSSSGSSSSSSSGGFSSGGGRSSSGGFRSGSSFNSGGASKLSAGVQGVKCAGHADAKLYPHPTRCDMYIQCVHGNPTERPCGPGTAFNPASQTCVWPQSAGCDRYDGLDNNDDFPDFDLSVEPEVRRLDLTQQGQSRFQQDLEQQQQVPTRLDLGQIQQSFSKLELGQQQQQIPRLDLGMLQQHGQIQQTATLVELGQQQQQAPRLDIGQLQQAASRLDLGQQQQTPPKLNIGQQQQLSQKLVVEEDEDELGQQQQIPAPLKLNQQQQVPIKLDDGQEQQVIQALQRGDLQLEKTSPSKGGKTAYCDCNKLIIDVPHKPEGVKSMLEFLYLGETEVEDVEALLDAALDNDLEEIIDILTEKTEVVQKASSNFAKKLIKQLKKMTRTEEKTTVTTTLEETEDTEETEETDVVKRRKEAKRKAERTKKLADKVFQKILKRDDIDELAKVLPVKPFVEYLEEKEMTTDYTTTTVIEYLEAAQTEEEQITTEELYTILDNLDLEKLNCTDLDRITSAVADGPFDGRRLLKKVMDMSLSGTGACHSACGECLRSYANHMKFHYAPTANWTSSASLVPTNSPGLETKLGSFFIGADEFTATLQRDLTPPREHNCIDGLVLQRAGPAGSKTQVKGTEFDMEIFIDPKGDRVKDCPLRTRVKYKFEDKRNTYKWSTKFDYEKPQDIYVKMNPTK